MLNYIQSQIMPILSDYEVDDQKLNQFSNQMKNFYNIIYSNDFAKKTASIANQMTANIEFEDSRIILDSVNDDTVTRILASKSSFRLIYELKNGMQQFKFFCAEFFVYFIPSGISSDFEPMSYLMKIDNIFLYCCLNSNIFSNFKILLDFLRWNLSRQSLRILLQVKDTFLKQSAITSPMSNISHSISESCDNINQNILFQPHRMSISSKRLEQNYNIYHVHVDQDLDIPMVSTMNQSLGSLVDISSTNSKLSLKIRSFQSYEIVSNILFNHVYKIPSQIISSYRGIGLYLFCRNFDGNYYPAIVLSRKRFMVQYGFFQQNKISSTILHRIVDDSSFAFMWDKITKNETVKNGETILVVEREISCIGRAARVQSSDETGITVIYFNSLNVAKVNYTSCIHLRPQSYGIKGLGSRYYGVYREKVEPVICTKINVDHEVYEIYANKSPISVKESDSLFVDTLTSPEILYCFQSALVIGSTDDNIFCVGNIVTKIDADTYVVLSSEGICLDSTRNNIFIKEPTQDKIATLPISMIEQEGSINARSINIFIEAEIGDKKMPLFFLDCPLSIQIYSWSKYEVNKSPSLSDAIKMLDEYSLILFKSKTTSLGTIC
ncbi:LOW QUALITY PROTEIN: hypothetical protein MXB_5637 [Myxobolus squamalis]|nr:LOW QUALITY PROTEIN: hypothetical protein MXB_5637 [Myxobolus squamalis]